MRLAIRAQSLATMQTMLEKWKNIGDLGAWKVFNTIFYSWRWSSTISEKSNKRLGGKSNISPSEITRALKFVSTYQKEIKKRFFDILRVQFSGTKFGESDFPVKGVVYNVSASLLSGSYALGYDLLSTR